MGYSSNERTNLPTEEEVVMEDNVGFSKPKKKIKMERMSLERESINKCSHNYWGGGA